MKYVAFPLALGAFIFINAQSSYAANYVCRGANAGFYARSVQQAVGKQLTAAKTPFRAIFVTIKATDRASTKTPASYDASQNITVAPDLSGITFQGSFPPPTACQLPATLRVVVMNGNVKVMDKSTAVTLGGTLLLGGNGSGSTGSSSNTGK